MKDPDFIRGMVAKAREGGDWVREELESLSPDLLNWQPGPGKWSIGQCLDHLIVSDCSYFPVFEKISEGKYRMTNWQKWSPLSGIFGTILADQLQEKVKKKLVAPKVFLPSEKVDAGIIIRFQKHLDSLIDYLVMMEKLDIDRIRITSPAMGFVTYNLRHAVKILVPHLRRHLRQALRVKNHKNFPVNRGSGG